jgi:hypothetical protein
MSTFFGITNKKKPMLVKKKHKVSKHHPMEIHVSCFITNLHMPAISSFATNYSQLGSLMYPNGPT